MTTISADQGSGLLCSDVGSPPCGQWSDIDIVSDKALEERRIANAGKLLLSGSGQWSHV